MSSSTGRARGRGGVTACAHCARIKVRCEGGRPCERCKRLKKVCSEQPPRAAAQRRPPLSPDSVPEMSQADLVAQLARVTAELHSVRDLLADLGVLGGATKDAPSRDSNVPAVAPSAASSSLAPPPPPQPTEALPVSEAECAELMELFFLTFNKFLEHADPSLVALARQPCDDDGARALRYATVSLMLRLQERPEHTVMFEHARVACSRVFDTKASPAIMGALLVVAEIFGARFELSPCRAFATLARSQGTELGLDPGCSIMVTCAALESASLALKNDIGVEGIEVMYEMARQGKSPVPAFPPVFGEESALLEQHITAVAEGRAPGDPGGLIFQGSCVLLAIVSQATQRDRLGEVSGALLAAFPLVDAMGLLIEKGAVGDTMQCCLVAMLQIFTAQLEYLIGHPEQGDELMRQVLAFLARNFELVRYCDTSLAFMLLYIAPLVVRPGAPVDLVRDLRDALAQQARLWEIAGAGVLWVDLKAAPPALD